MQAIETVYKGYRFRSRLEARWAVFFDALGIEYKYEPEGYDLDGTFYLPDFYLPRHEIYVEIKPFDSEVVKYEGDFNRWERKCAKFRDLVGKPILLCYDDPAADRNRYLFCWDCSDSSAGSSNWWVFFTKDGDLIAESCSHELWVSPLGDTNPHVRIADREEWKALFEYRWYNPKNNDRLTVAKTKARQARFEHGEKPEV